VRLRVQPPERRPRHDRGVLRPGRRRPAGLHHGGPGKALAVKRDPKVSLCILDEQWPLTYLQVYGDATLEEDFGQAVDVLRRVIDLMAEKDVTSAKLPEIERMAREENRVVIRVRPYATFATPPRHVYKAGDIDTLTHFTSNSQPW
jgi:hypothetical protein